MVARLDGAAELEIEKLHAVTDPEHRHVERTQRFEIEIRGIWLGRALGAARKNDRSGFANVRKILDGIKAREKPKLAGAADDELCVLRAEINDGDVVGFVHGVERIFEIGMLGY